MKNHVFFEEHQLDDRIARFDPDYQMAMAWKRLEKGNYKESDIDLLNHEYFESRFMGLYQTDYRTAHNATVKSGRTWNP
ncbi:hypothetical protein IC619_000175 [Hazenella sp. IB182353]|uniref:hypothetical protein n=1 Tax=Polycladospora coralii TaxID=2771432 RepID=UPI0017476617|nr:hypothetical protein [Polycladospora coralii]MBS7528911.1 hypothetical protein [Polycladospora coralii]